jgi:hypothetical protein
MPITDAETIAEYMGKYAIQTLNNTIDDDGQIAVETPLATPDSISVFTTDTATEDQKQLSYLVEDQSSIAYGSGNEVLFLGTISLKDEDNVWTEVTE